MTRSRRRRTPGSTPNLKQSTKSRTLAQLLDTTDRGALIELVRRLVALNPEAERTCFEYLREHTAGTPNAKARAAAGAAHALWSEIESDLAELDDFGGGDYATQDDVADRLHELEQVLRTHPIHRDDRRALLDDVLPYIQSGNAGMDDALYDVAYATCCDEEDLRKLAERFEAIAQDGPIDHARRIYRQLGDRENYLRLRRHRMQYGADYHDLAIFYWEQGEGRQAMDTAREGLNKAEGRMDGLRAFLAERAKTAGDRHGYLDLQLAQAVEHLTLASYKAFRKVRKAGEWKAYEPRVLEALTSAWEEEQLAIRMHRGEYDRAVTILATMKYPDDRYGPGEVLRAAAKLEQMYPEQILAFYLSALKRTYNPTRNTYARWAGAVQRARHVWIDFLQKPAKWDDGDRMAKNSRDTAGALRLSKRRLDELVEEATVDCYNEDEQLTGLLTMIQDHLAVPFEPEILGVTVTVERVDSNDRNEVVAFCRHGRERQAVPVLDLPLPSPAPEGAEWIAAYRHWARSTT